MLFYVENFTNKTKPPKRGKRKGKRKKNKKVTFYLSNCYSTNQIYFQKNSIKHLQFSFTTHNIAVPIE
jgi:hypothetical protein